MKQKIQDATQLLKRDRKWQVIAVAVTLGILVAVVTRPEAPKKRRAQPQNVTSSGVLDKNEAYTDIFRTFDARFEEINAANFRQDERLELLRNEQAESEATTAEILKKILVRVEERNINAPAISNAALGSALPLDLIQPSDSMATAGMFYPEMQAPVDEISSFGDTQAAIVAPPAPPAPGKVAFIGAGDSVRIRLLAGVNAPTDGTPYPVVLQTISDVAGPDGSSLPIGEARVIAAAQGSLTDSRALLRLTQLSIRLPNGRRKVYPVDGWIVGEDGLRGMGGILIDPMGKAIAGSALAGTASGLGTAFANTQASTSRSFFGSETTITGDPFKYMLGQGINKAGDEWSSIIKDRLRQLVPHVQILSGREATAVFSKDLAIQGLFEALHAEDSDGAIE